MSRYTIKATLKRDKGRDVVNVSYNTFPDLIAVREHLNNLLGNDAEWSANRREVKFGKITYNIITLQSALPYRIKQNPNCK